MLRFGGGRSSTVHSVSLEYLVEIEQYNNTTDKERRQNIEIIHTNILQIIKQIFDIQSYLINLRTAYNAHILPKGYEVRINIETGLPYWVDHMTKTTHTTPPTPPTTNTSSIHNTTSITSSSSILQNSKTSKHLHSATSESSTNQPEIIKKRGISSFTLDTLPEYRLHTSHITQLFDQLHKLSLKQKRCLARLRPSEYGGIYAVKQAIETSIVDSSEILFTTLSSCGHSSLESTEFVVTIIDEAAQSVEPSILIPLRRGCQHCILVGDPYQLPATIFSGRLKSLGYARSLFERLVDTGHNKVLLNIQYRMTPEISLFPRLRFYAGDLMDGANVNCHNYCPSYINTSTTSQNSDLSLHTLTSSSTTPAATTSNNTTALTSYTKKDCSKNTHQKPNVFKPFLFFDLGTSRDERASESLSKFNTEEALLTLQIIALLLEESQRSDLPSPPPSTSTAATASTATTNTTSDATTEGTAAASSVGSAVPTLGSIGVITPYSEQVKEAKRLMKQRYPHWSVKQSYNKKERRGNTPATTTNTTTTTTQPLLPSTVTTNTITTSTANTVEIIDVDEEEGEEGEIIESTPTPSLVPEPITSYRASDTPYELDLELNTVDAFQGKEKDFVLISCVRANDSNSVGFLNDFRRMNVAITRAKYGLFVIGHGPTLRSNTLWNDFVMYAERSSSYIHIPSTICNIREIMTEFAIRISKSNMKAASGYSVARSIKRPLAQAVGVEASRDSIHTQVGGAKGVRDSGGTLGIVRSVVQPTRTSHDVIESKEEEGEVMEEYTPNGHNYDPLQLYTPPNSQATDTGPEPSFSPIVLPSPAKKRKF